MTAPRVGVIGARRRRQGLGPFVVKYLAASGASVPAFVGTSDDTCAEAAAELRRLAGVEAAGYTDAEAMVAQCELDALAILSPPETHLAWLEFALEHRLHVLCEKPLVWGDASAFARAAQLPAAFAARGRRLTENCQWPCTLPAFATLYPGALDRPPERFEMGLSPASVGLDMLVDSLSHPLSLLQALAPGRNVDLEQIRFSATGPDVAETDVRFLFVSDGAPVEVRVNLRHAATEPRQAWFSVDGRRARRVVRTADYALFFSDGTRVVDVPDPLRLLVEGWVASMKGASPLDPSEGDRATEQRVTLLDRLLTAFRDPAA